MKDEKGITIIVLVITVIVMLIILGITVSSGSNSIETAQLQSFIADCEVIQSKVDVISEKARLNSAYIENIGITNGTQWTNEDLKTNFNISNLTHDVIAKFAVMEDRNLTDGQDKVTVTITITNNQDVLFNKYYWNKGKIQTGMLRGE